MTAIQQLRHSQVLIWLMVFLLAILIVLAVLVRVAGAAPGESWEEPVAEFIVSPSAGMFVAGDYSESRRGQAATHRSEVLTITLPNAEAAKPGRSR